MFRLGRGRAVALLVALFASTLTIAVGAGPVTESSRVLAVGAPTPILWLDASNPASYPGSGTAWTDLSPSGRVATISAGVTFDATNSALSFPGGTNGNGGFVDLGGDLGSFSNGITIEFEGEFGATRAQWERIFDFAQGVAPNPNNSFWVGHFENTNELAIEVFNGQNRFGYCHTATNSTALGPLGERTFYKWVITIGTDANNTCRIFRNGVEMTTRFNPDLAQFASNPSSVGANVTGSAFTLPPTVVRTTNFLGRSNFSVDPDLEGSIRYIRIYNTSLTAQQVAVNANATVTFENNGGVGTMAPQSSTVSATLAPNTFTRVNHTFASWNTTVSGQGASYNNGAMFPFTADTTLYARWNPITLTFDPNGGSGVMATHSASAGFNLPANAFSRGGYAFTGWNTAANGSGTSIGNGAAFAFSADTTLYAQWAAYLPPFVVPTTTTTTVPPATTTTVPQPAPLPSGALPVVDPGKGQAFENQRGVPTRVFVENERSLVMSGLNFELRISGSCQSRCIVTESPGATPTITLDSAGEAFVDGFGFQPLSRVNVWAFSDPRYIGAVDVGADGKFRGAFPLSGLSPGRHTLQVNGSSADGVQRSANLGVFVRSSVNLPVTGSDGSSRLVLVALAIAILGLAIRSRVRRPISS